MPDKWGLTPFVGGSSAGAALLDPRHFWQVHRGTIVDMRAIAAVAIDELGRREITLRDRPEKLEVSRSFAHLFKPS